MKLEEEWKPIKDYSDYIISNFGRIWTDRTWGHKDSTNNGRFLKGRIRKYHFIGLVNEKGLHEFRIHRLVLEAFIGPCPEGYQCNHKDGNKLNNRIDNLEWVTCSVNHEHAFATGLRSHKGESHPQSFLNDEEVKLMRKLFKQGLSRTLICDLFSVEYTHLCRILRGELWKHITI